MSSIERQILTVTALLLCAVLLVVPVAARNDGLVEAALADGALVAAVAGAAKGAYGKIGDEIAINITYRCTTTLCRKF